MRCGLWQEHCSPFKGQSIFKFNLEMYWQPDGTREEQEFQTEIQRSAETERFFCFILFFTFWLLYPLNVPHAKSLPLVLFSSPLFWALALWWQNQRLPVIDCSTPPSFPRREALAVCRGCWFSAWEEGGFLDHFLVALSLREPASLRNV